MPALPTVGGSTGTWGNELNAFLQVAHRADGVLAGTPSGVFNPKDSYYGALGDGSQDDTSRIQACFDDSKNEGPVVVPRGLYKLTSTVNLPDGAHILGAGSAYSTGSQLGQTTFLRSHNDSTPTFQSASNNYLSNFVMRDLNVIGGTSAPGTPATTQDCFVIYGACNNTRFENVMVGWHKGSAWRLEQQTAVPGDLSSGLNFVMDQCFAWTNAGYALKQTGNPAFVSSMCDFNGNLTGQIYMTGATGNQGHAVFVGLLIESGSATGATVAIEFNDMGAQPVTICGATIVGPAAGADAIKLTGASIANVIATGVSGFNWTNWLNDTINSKTIPWSNRTNFYYRDRPIFANGICVGGTAAATTPGAVVKKLQIFDEAGSSLGYIPIYSTIT